MIDSKKKKTTKMYIKWNDKVDETNKGRVAGDFFSDVMKVMEKYGIECLGCGECDSITDTNGRAVMRNADQPTYRELERKISELMQQVYTIHGDRLDLQAEVVRLKTELEDCQLAAIHAERERCAYIAETRINHIVIRDDGSYPPKKEHGMFIAIEIRKGES